MFRFISSLGKRVSPWTHVNEAVTRYHKAIPSTPQFYCSSSNGPEDTDGQDNAGGQGDENNKKSFTIKKDDIFTISLVGRPNVGKSSLFNRLGEEGASKAITDRMPGLTRDRKEHITTVLGYPLRFVDTAGVERLPNDQRKAAARALPIKEKMMNQTLQALIYSDMTLFMLDAKQGVTTRDRELARWLKQRLLQGKSEEVIKRMENQDESTKDVIIQRLLLLANKADSESVVEDSNILNDVYSLGLGEPLLISTQQGDGLVELLRKIDNEVPQSFKDNFQSKRMKRIEKFESIKMKQRQEILELIQTKQLPDDIDISMWEREFDSANANPEENSDLDSDNDLYVEDMLKNTKDDLLGEEKGVHVNKPSKKPIQMSIIGRSNSGKSTLVNSLLQDERVIADDVAGTTRDAIKIQWIYKGRKIDLVDTAGIDKKITKVSEVEKKIQNDTIRAVKQSHVVVCMIDALRAFQTQDLSLAQYVCDQGRALIIVVNKWDLVPEEYRKKALKYMNKQLEKNLAQVRGVHLLCMSAKNSTTDQETMMNYVLDSYEKWNIRISTGTLNDWLNRFKKVQNTPTDGGNRLKIRFVSEVKARPPTFVVFVNDKSLFKPNYMRFMRQKLGEEFGLEGTPIRFIVRETDQIVRDPKKLSEKYIEHKRMKKVVTKYKRNLKQAREKLNSFNAASSNPKPK